MRRLSRRCTRPATAEISGDSVAFYQRRVALFGLLGSSFGLAFLVFNIVGFLQIGKDWVRDPEMHFHAAGIVATALIWLLCRRGVRSQAYVQTVEAVGLVAACVAYEAMGFAIPLIAGPGYIILFVLSLVFLARTVWVPSTPRRTLILGLILGLPLAPWTYAHMSAIEPAHFELVAGVMPVASVHELAVQSAFGMGFSWLMMTLLATGASRVIYGLRREAREALRLGQYVLEEKLGEGGMGMVYRASHAMLRRPTAVKLLRQERTGEASLARFEREVQLTARLTHPHTVTVFDYGRSDDGVFYYAMELLNGASLESVVAEAGPLPPERVAHVLYHVADALAEAHEIGLIHRDVKPANIILCRQGGRHDFPKVVDFGLVKDLEGGAAVSLTQADVITGTPLYLSPEAITAPETVGARSDLYSLGAVGYFMLTGEHVFTGKTLVEVCSHHLHTAPVPPSTRVARPVPGDLESVVLDCLAKDPEARPGSAAELCRRLEACDCHGRWTSDDAQAWWTAHGPAATARVQESVASPVTLTKIG